MISIRRIIVAVVLLEILSFQTAVYAADLTISVNAAAPVRQIPETMYGGAMVAWWGFENGYNTAFNNLSLAKSQQIIRWPGGSWGVAYLWSDMEGPGGGNGGIINYNEQNYMMSILDAEMQPIVNFPGYWYNTDHSLQEAIDAAVAWVADQTTRPHPAQYWEIGNETGGFWEAGWFQGINGTYYGDQFADFYLAMKAVNPNIKIGANAEPTNRYGNGGSQDYVGYWDHDLLLAAKAKGVVPDFFIIHQYPGTNQGASYNPTLLTTDVDTIATYTSNMNTIITNTIGPEYVGKIGYFMTEWNAGGVDGSYERWRKYSGAMFMAEYLMKMSASGWEGSTTFGDFFYRPGTGMGYPDFYPFPDWYLYPFFIDKFGRNMVTASSSSSTVRAYSSLDDNDNLTMFIVNNSPTTNLTATINISGMTIATGGQRWIMEPAGTIPSGGNVQDVNDIQINGIFHPEPTTINSLAPQSFTSGSSFDINLPKSCMVFLRIPGSGVDTTSPAAPTGLAVTDSEGQISLDWNNNTEGDLASYNIYRSTVSGSGYVKQNNLPVSISNYVDYHAIGGFTYYYVVRAVDMFWNESDNSSQISAEITDTTPPAPPAGLMALGYEGMVSLNWNDNGGDTTGYNVYRSTTSGSDYVLLNGMPLSISDYNDNSVTNGTTYYYVVTAVDAYLNESDASAQVSASPNVFIQNIYSFVGINAANTNYNVYACDVDQFPFGGNSTYRNSQVEAIDSQYTAVSADDATEWAPINPGSSDEILLWVEMKINESPASISRIDLVFDGYTSGSGDVTHRIFVLTAGADWTQDASWTQVGADQGISPGTYATMTRSITSNISNYIDAGGRITWAVFETASAQVMHVNYLKMTVYTIVDEDAPAAPANLSVAAGNEQVSLEWNDNVEEDMNGYNVYRSPASGGPYGKLNTSLVVESNYIDVTVANGTTYYYAVTAVNTGGSESGYSNEVSAKPDLFQNCPEVHAGGYGLPSDLDGDCYVGYLDVYVLADYWLQTCADDCEGADFEPADGTVNFLDFSDFVVQWLWCNDPQNPNCVHNW